MRPVLIAGYTNTGPLIGSRDSTPVECVLLDALIVLIEAGLQEQKGGNPPDHLRHVARFIGAQVTAQNLPLAIAQPFIDDLVSADVVAPPTLWDVAPIGPVVQVDIAGDLPPITPPTIVIVR